MTTTAAQAPAAVSIDPPAYRWRWIALFVILAAEVMDLLDALVTTIAGPTIRAEIGGSESLIQWLAAGYTLAFAVGLVTGGRLGDLYGRRRIFLGGLAGFVVTSALCGLAVSPEMLIASRVLQGLFGAILIPQGFGIIKSVFPPRELGAAFGSFGPAMGLSAVGGPILAGALVAWDLGGLGWRTVFLITCRSGWPASRSRGRCCPSPAPTTAHGPTRSACSWSARASCCWCSRWCKAASSAGPHGCSGCSPHRCRCSFCSGCTRCAV